MPSVARLASVLLVAFALLGPFTGVAHAEPPEAAGPPVVVAPPAPPATPERPPLTSRLARDAIARALAVARYAKAQAELDGLASRARSAALLPEVSFRVLRSTDESLRLTPTADDPSRYSESGGAGLWLEGRLTWDLDRLMYDRDELAVTKARTERAAQAGRLVTRVLSTLFAWQRAGLKSADTTLLPEERGAARLAADEAEITLDVLTDGWFGRAIRPGRAASPR